MSISAIKYKSFIEQTKLPNEKQLVNLIYKEYMNNTYIGKVKEFMTLFGQPVVNKPAIMPEDRNKLRIALIFEELKEYAEASGLSHYFSDLCHTGKMSMQEEIDYKPAKDLVEQFDALLDMQYVLSGAVLENGFGNIFDKGFDEVHRSNMSKACYSDVVALQTMTKYGNDNIETYCDRNNFPAIVYRKQDMKVLKSTEYSPANLLSIIEDETN